jgi:hypothetical protein
LLTWAKTGRTTLRLRSTRRGLIRGLALTLTLKPPTFLFELLSLTLKIALFTSIIRVVTVITTVIRSGRRRTVRPTPIRAAVSITRVIKTRATVCYKTY